MAPASKINLKDRLEDGGLDLSMSGLQEVPVKEIATVKKATSLDLSNNRLVTLGKNFTILTHITKLDLSNNLIKELPDNFGDMKQLKHLDLYSNQLKHLPLSFGELKSLRWLDVKNNPLVPALLQVAGPCLEAKQCQQCAIKVVSFMSNAQAKIEEEKHRRALQRQKDLERNEAAAAAAVPVATTASTATISKSQMKKNKKANKAAEKPKVDVNGTASATSAASVATKSNTKHVMNEPVKIKAVKTKAAKVQEKPRPKSTFYKDLFYQLIFFVVFFMLMFALIVVFFPDAVGNVPPYVTEFVDDYVVPTARFVRVKAADLGDKVAELHAPLYQNEQFRICEDYILQLWDACRVKLSELFRTPVNDE